MLRLRNLRAVGIACFAFLLSPRCTHSPRSQPPPPREQLTQTPLGSADDLVRELAWGACHSGVAMPRDPHGTAPPLGSAGFKYYPAYLFAYLQDPARDR